MEFDEVNQNTNLSIGVIEVIPTVAYSTNVTINCNKIYSNCRNAFAITIRGNSNFNLKELDVLDHSVVALELYDIIRKWGLHVLPSRVLHELDVRLNRIASNLEYVNYEK